MNHTVSAIKEKLRSFYKTDELAYASRKATSSSADLSRLGLQRINNEYGSLLVREKRFPLDFGHGGRALADFLLLSHKQFSYINKQDFSPSLLSEDFVFLDTETTGLAGGSGTYIFLAGCGYFTNDVFIVKQFLLTDHQNEYAFLYHVATLLKSFKGIISYNGKSYDVPLLKTRFILNRLAEDFERFIHIDLLHCSRRLWKKHLKECNLGNIEKKLLGFVRQDDIASADIPGKFVAYLQTGTVELLSPVYKHNCIDIMSMVSIAILAAAAFDCSQNEKIAAHTDKRSLFKVFMALQEYDAAFQLAEKSYEDNDVHLLLDYSYALKKRGNFDKAVKVWEHLIAQSSFIEPAYLELAKYFEHRECTFSKALDIIDRVQKRREILDELGVAGEMLGAEEWQHRKKRVLAKISCSEKKNSIGKTA